MLDVIKMIVTVFTLGSVLMIGSMVVAETLALSM